MNKIYLIYGNEQYFIDEYVNELKKKYSTYDLVCFDMLSSNISDALEDALMQSLFSSNKLIICDNSYFLTASKCEIEHNIDNLHNYINLESDNILALVVNSDSLDKRKKIVKELENVATVDVCNKLKGYELNNFVKEYINKYGYKIDNDALVLFLSKLNDDLYIITSELDKMFIYKDEDKLINKKDVEAITSKIINDNIFDLIDAITKKDIDKSLELYDDLLLINEEEIKLIIILANQFRLIYQVKEMYDIGYNEVSIIKTLGVHPYRIKLAKNIDISKKEALLYLKKLAYLDEMIKTGKIDKKEGFHKFILEI